MIKKITQLNGVQLVLCMVLISCSQFLYAQFDFTIVSADGSEVIYLEDGGSYDISHMGNYYFEYATNNTSLDYIIEIDGESVEDDAAPFTFPEGAEAAADDDGADDAYWLASPGWHSIKISYTNQGGQDLGSEEINVQINDFNVVPDTFDYSADDQVAIEVINIPIERDGSEHATVDPTNLRQVIAEVVYKGGTPGDTATFEDQDGNQVTVDVIQPEGANGVRIFRAAFPGTATDIYYNNTASTNRLNAFILTTFRDDASAPAASGFVINEGGYNHKNTFQIEVEPLAQQADLEFVFPFSEMTDDGRYLSLTVEAGGQTFNEVIYGPEAGSCCTHFIEGTLQAVPMNTSTIDVTIETRHGQDPNGTNENGQSYVLSSVLSFAQTNVIPLPVELSAFNAELEGQAVALNWVTASETDNDYFDVERSVDGVEFTAIDRVFGNGTTTATSYYNFVDGLEGVNAEIVYYRLKQVDYDGTSAYSKIVAVQLTSAFKNTEVFYIGSDMIRLIAGQDAPIHDIKIFNISGALESQQDINGETLVDLNTSTMARGAYVLLINDVEAKKVIVR
ncbi:MAG: T9SS type A sorting domain-containing protein [Saprospiraceae bacterium]|nr:T9SS type A sorting domain-containing protein [Saprospiraceae bacterium]